MVIVEGVVLTSGLGVEITDGVAFVGVVGEEPLVDIVVGLTAVVVRGLSVVAFV